MRISRYPPRFDPGFPLIGSCSLIWPAAWMLEKARRLSREEYHAAYTQLLDKVGVERIIDRLQQLHEVARSRPLVLLCYEDLRKPELWCHRRMFADWWHAQTGDVIPELDLPPLQHTHLQPTLF